MYNGNLSISDASDLGVLKQQNELIATLNNQLKEFSSLKSNVSAVFDVFIKKSPAVSEAATTLSEAAAAGSKLNGVAQSSATLMSDMAESTNLCSDAVSSATGANQALTNVMSLSTAQITAIIVAITAVVAAITTFVKWINRTNEAGEAAKTSAENLVTAQEELSQSAIDSSAAYVTGSFYK